MRSTIIHDLPDWRVTSWGNGLAYEVEVLDCGTDAQKIIDFDVALYQARERGHKTVFEGAGYAPADG